MACKTSDLLTGIRKMPAHDPRRSFVEKPGNINATTKRCIRALNLTNSHAANTIFVQNN